jgi:hypothetical protein
MSRYIVRIHGPQGYLFGEWCTVVDAPTTPLMTDELFCAWYYATYDRKSYHARITRTIETGTSALNETLADILAHNSAGPKMTTLSTAQIYEQYALPAAVLDGRVSVRMERSK